MLILKNHSFFEISCSFLLKKRAFLQISGAFFAIFRHFFLACLTQTAQTNSPTPIFTPKTHILRKNNPQKPLFSSKSQQFQFQNLSICATYCSAESFSMPFFL